jgi:matrilin-3
MSTTTPTTTYTTTTNPACPYTPIDLAFVLDTSGSMSSISVAQMLDFTAKLTQMLPRSIGVDGAADSRVAAINFDSSSRLVFDFNAYSTSASAGSALRAITPVVQNGGTATHQAVNLLRTTLLSESSGWRASAVPTVVVFVTDGAASDAKKTDLAIANLDATFGFTVDRFAIGVGDFNSTQLSLLAHGDASHITTFNAFVGLVDDSFISTFISQIFCQV